MTRLPSPSTSSTDKIVQAAVIGTGDYATAIVTQAEYIPRLNIPILADTDTEASRRAYRLAGIDDDQIIVADNRAKALSAIERGRKVVVEDGYLLMDLPLDVIAEGTGNTTAGAMFAARALQHGKHVVMITKETEVVVGTILRKMARDAGLVYTGADGDQPALLIALIEWCRSIGMEVLCGGKFGEKRLFLDLNAPELQLPGGRSVSLTDTQLESFQPMVDRNDARNYQGQAGLSRMIDVLAEREALIGKHADIRTDDLTELCIVANATDLDIDAKRLHNPVMWPNEIPAVLAPTEYGGILGKTGVIDQATYFNTPNGTSMGGGVFATVHTDSEYSNSIICGKGHMGNPDGSSGLIFRPYHLCGVETPYSILAAALENRPTSGWSMSQKFDSFGRATVNLSAGATISDSHGTDFETFLASAVKVKDAVTSRDPVPFHIVTGMKLNQDISTGTVITQGMVKELGASPLWKLRAQQDGG